MEEGRSDFKSLTGNPIASIRLGSPRRKWQYNIRINVEVMS